jgi:tRNA(Arg) A34 adenosine deaminase TadA
MGGKSNKSKPGELIRRLGELVHDTRFWLDINERQELHVLIGTEETRDMIAADGKAYFPNTSATAHLVKEFCGIRCEWFKTLEGCEFCARMCQQTGVNCIILVCDKPEEKESVRSRPNEQT